MKVLLTQTLDRIGIVGDVLDVSDGFARNFLLPKGIAVQPTDGNIKRLESARKDYEAKLKALREQKEKLLATLTGVEITITRNANDEGHLFGSVSKRDIADELQKAGHNISADEVKLDEPLRRVDTYMIAIQLAADLKGEIKLWIVRDKKEGEAAAAAKAAEENDAEETE
jgi:large subunit ribosomal protein L9